MTTASKGDLLISEPFIKDPTFGRTVILIVEKNNLGTVGFVINQKLTLSVSEIIDSLPIANTLYSGGPVAHDSLHFIYKGENPVEGSIKVLDNLYWGGNFDELIIKVQLGLIEPENLRFFIGYSGWDVGQLEQEISDKTWIVAKADIKSIFNPQPATLWKQSMKALGKDYAILANSPIDPKLN
jgi:putative transcriptional regulator